MALLTGTVTAIVAFVAMEPLTAATHRWVMHGIGSRLHRSHHQRPGSQGWEANDWYPVMFAAVVVAAMWAGFHRDDLAALVPAGIGVTAYGACYALVHDVYIHGRLPWARRRAVTPLDRLAAAHHIHHRYGRAPYGMLLPVVPAELRARAETAHRDPLAGVSS